MLRSVMRAAALVVALLLSATAAQAQLGGGSGVPSTKVSLTPVVTSGSAYAANAEVGPLLAFPLAYNNLTTGIVETVSIASKSAQSNAYTLCLFYSQPTNTTWGDFTTPVLAAADNAKLAGCQSISAYSNQLATSYVVPALNWLVPSATTTVYGALFTQAAVTYSSTSDLTITLATLPG